MAIPTPITIGAVDDISNINNFRSLMSAMGGPGTQSRYYADVIAPAAVSSGGGSQNFTDLKFLCEAAEFPGKGLKTTEINHYGPAFQIPYQISFEPIDLNFICRDYMTERLAFDEWMHYISPYNNYDFAFPEDYEGEVHIYQVTQNNRSFYKFILQRAYPVMVSKQPVTWIEQEIQRLSVTFVYNQWAREKIDV
jgi:hypothetical protein